MKLSVLFFELIKVSLKKKQQFLSVPSEEEWQELFTYARKQALIGVLFTGIQLLPESQRPHRELLIKWYILTEQIKKQNTLLNIRALETSAYFTDHGFANCVLKGQGLATLYPDPLLRMSGDIDIWLGGGRERIFKFVAKKGRLQGVNYHHVSYPLYDNTEVEVHVLPNRLNNPFLNHKLQTYFREISPIQYGNLVDLPGGVGRIPVPTTQFNAFYVLLHIYHHLFGEGIGLRQLMDYYYVLLQPMTNDERIELLTLFKRFKMMRFVKATMYVMQEVFGLEEKFLLTQPSKTDGKFLLSEIMQAGNFGQYDERSKGRSRSAIKRFASSLKRNVRFLRYYPSEVLWDVPFRIWLYMWRKWKRYI